MLAMMMPEWRDGPLGTQRNELADANFRNAALRLSQGGPAGAAASAQVRLPVRRVGAGSQQGGRTTNPRESGSSSVAPQDQLEQLCVEWLLEPVYSECYALLLPRVLSLPLAQQHQVLQLLGPLVQGAEPSAVQQPAVEVLRVMASVNSGGGLSTALPGQALMASYAQQALHRCAGGGACLAGRAGRARPRTLHQPAVLPGTGGGRRQALVRSQVWALPGCRRWRCTCPRAARGGARRPCSQT
jgi:hypothetical protein